MADDTVALLQDLRQGVKSVDYLSKKELARVLRKLLISPLAGMTPSDDDRVFESEVRRIMSIYLDAGALTPIDLARKIGSGVKFDTLLAFVHILHTYIGIISSARAITNAHPGALVDMGSRFTQLADEAKRGESTVQLMDQTTDVPLDLAVETFALLTEVSRLADIAAG